MAQRFRVWRNVKNSVLEILFFFSIKFSRQPSAALIANIPRTIRFVSLIFDSINRHRVITAHGIRPTMKKTEKPSTAGKQKADIRVGNVIAVKIVFADAPLRSTCAMYINIVHLAHRQLRMSGAVYQLKRMEWELYLHPHTRKLPVAFTGGMS